ncbi:MAG: efflux transporter outer membrane subunit [Verrucomicrobiales bacterium]|nr:efflux transporter outer membrane subunit [Verrucomicrobiales bacterium]MCP5558703.1 efflux transporter outer membrane subunit [Verrucomicrobiaceae bacterium]
MQPTKLLLLLLFGITTGCTVGPRFKQPQPEMPSDFASPSSSAKSASVDAAWWRRLNDSTLNDLIHQAAEQNKSLAASQSRLLEARALWREARFDYAPTVRSSVSYENSRSGVSTLNAQRGRSFELYRAGFDASWELDVFGRVRNSVKAAKATAAAVEADLNNLRITVSSEVAINYLELRGAQAQLAVARENAANQAESRRIAEVSLKGGRGTQLDVARANALWNDTQAQLPVYEQNVARAIHRIAVLCGRNPSDLRARLQSAKPQPTPPSRLDIVKPADLLRRRPDIRTAEQVLAAQTARVGIAVADLFPRLTFNGRVGLEAGQLSGLSQSGAGGSSFGPHLSWAAFDLGRVRQQIAAAGHRADVALSEYEQTVLLALEEAENALTSYDRERVRLHHLEASAASAREAVTLARQRYQDGIADFLTVLDAERVVLNTQNEIVLSRTRVASAWVSIYKAMGGGWNG